MADKFDIQILGDKSLAKAFDTLPRAAQSRGIRKSFVKGSALIRKTVRALVPGSGENRQKLRRGIKAKFGRRRRRGSIARFVSLPSRDFLGIASDDRNYWPAALEYGHVLVSRAGRIIGQVPPVSFLRKGYDQVERRVIEIIRRELGAAINREWSKGAK